LAFEVSSLADLRAFHKHIIDRGLPIKMVLNHGVSLSFYFADPEGHMIELDMPAALEIFGALSRINGSIGWTAMIGGGCDIFASLLPRDTYEQVYQNGPDVIIAGSAQPVGRAEAVAGGWRVNGRWPFGPYR
jgi:hypothetical protein